MADERKIYPPIDEVPLRHTPNMSQEPPNSMPLPQEATYPMPQSPPYSMPQSPPYSKPQSPPYSMPQSPPYSVPQSPPYPMPQSAQNLRPLIGQVPLGPTPSSVTCPSCGASIVTDVRVEPSTQTHLMALVLCFLCICLTCVPYCVDSCQNVNHHCPNCDCYLGTYKR